MSASTKRRGTGGKPKPQRRGGLPVVPIAIAFVVLAAVVALVLAGGDGEVKSDARSQYGAVEIDGTALPPLAGATPDADPAVAMAAPTLTGTNFEGDPVTVPSSERPTLLVFAAHWCPHCQAEIPRLVDWMAAGGAEDVQVVAVSTAADPQAPNWTPQAWLEREGWEAPVLADDAEGSAGSAYGVDGYPFFTLVDESGTVVWRASGEISTEVLDAVLATLP